MFINLIYRPLLVLLYNFINLSLIIKKIIIIIIIFSILFSFFSSFKLYYCEIISYKN